MPNILPALSEYIRRLARREIRAQVSRSRKSSSKHRRDIALLKRQVRSLTSRLAKVERGAPEPLVKVTAGSDADLRFRQDGFRTHRAKLGLSAKDYGALIGVTGLTVYNWEHGKAKPRRSQLPAIAAVRALGKREALARLSGN